MKSEIEVTEILNKILNELDLTLLKSLNEIDFTESDIQILHQLELVHKPCSPISLNRENRFYPFTSIRMAHPVFQNFATSEKDDFAKFHENISYIAVFVLQEILQIGNFLQNKLRYVQKYSGGLQCLHSDKVIYLFINNHEQTQNFQII